jgi:hypothetical protein
MAEPTEAQNPTLPSFLPDAALIDPRDAIDAIEAEQLGDPDPNVDLVVLPEAAAPVGRAPIFDFTTRRFVTGRGKGPAFGRGDDTLRGRIVVALQTDRGAHPIFPDDFGMEKPYDMIGLPITDPVWADLEERVRTALTFYDEISDVTDFEITSDPLDTAVTVNFTVVLTDGSSADVTGLDLT